MIPHDAKRMASLMLFQIQKAGSLFKPSKYVSDISWYSPPFFFFSTNVPLFTRLKQ